MRGQLKSEARLRISNTRLKKNNQELRDENKRLLRENHELKAKLEDKESQRKELLKKIYKENKKENGCKKLGKKPGAAGYRRPKPRDDEVTEETKYTPIKCPYCRGKDCLGDVKEEIVKYHEDIIMVPDKIVKKYVITKHWCSCCKEYVRSNKVPPNIERIGPNVMAYILYARYRLRLPFHLIKQSLQDLHNFKISEGEISNQLEKAKELFTKDYDAVCELIKISDKVYCDETGWRIRGKNFWIWVFVTENDVRYVIEDTRGKGVAERALGSDNDDRVLISDFYAAYKNLAGKNQYCWVHLLRDSKATESIFHQDLKEIYQKLNKELVKEVNKRDSSELDQLLKDVEEKKYKDGIQEKIKRLQKRIRRTRKQLIECLKHKNVRPENNTAERALRNNVVMRKIFGCSRSLESAKVMETNLTVIDSAMQKNPDKTFIDVILPKLKELRGED